ncbi:CDGSH iron-sulfur domain-containing protein NEET [Cynara cardunculus var. scolymus]|uniref:CDGSH iron-sulfur domain-containing protein NEET n=1 Tax=Cynara cardunculus var. scolymus TaxID=59895 RepID=UPI000D6236D8|nr:CDGSH iron-sulfur domain-containing protein NEET [Cynara cardunculus var. scolymus]
MASIVGVGIPFALSSSPQALKRSTIGGGVTIRSSRRMVAVRAEGGGINPEIRKNEDKVVDSVVVTELSNPVTAYCRCWRSGTFPLCDGSHVKHNKANEDNVGPLLLKKQ